MNCIRFALLGCLLVLSACSSYDTRWRQVRSSRLALDPVQGAYEGEWKSGRYNAGGKLWCILTKKSSREYLAEFKATWHGVFSSCHSVVLKTTGKEGKPQRFTGEATISMWIGSGNYRCDGLLTPAKVVDCTGQSMTGSGPGTKSHEAATGKLLNWDMPRVMSPARLSAKYDATYDKGTMELWKRSHR